jgi:hypothetical protein
VGLVPRLTSPTQFRIAVQGPVDPATVKAFTIGATKGTTSVLLVNLTELALMHVGTGLPHVTASYDSGGGDIVIDADAPFIVGDLYGVFLRKEMHDDKGNSLVPSPISVLLTLKGALVDGAMHSTISTVGDGDAATLDIGRQQLAALFAPAPQGTANALTGDFLTPADLVYAYAFQLGSAP